MPKRRKSIEQAQFVKTLATLKPDKQRSILHFLDNEGINLLCECTANLIFSDIGLSNAEKKRLKGKIIGKEKLLRFISKKSNKVSSRKKKLLQTGGALGTILAIAAPILLDLVTRAFSKRK